MAVFSTNDEVNDQRLDWVILRDGGVVLYWRAEILAYDLKWLESNGYRIASFETADWLSESQLHESLKAELSFPAYYGDNLNALDECMWDDLVVPDAGGLVLVLNQYDRFAKADIGGDRMGEAQPRSCSTYSREQLGITCCQGGGCSFSCSPMTRG
jgi:hypothetical protein